MHNAKVEDKTSMFIAAANNLYYFQILLIVLCEIWFYSLAIADQNSKVEQVFELNTEKTSIDNPNLNRESKVRTKFQLASQHKKVDELQNLQKVTIIKIKTHLDHDVL